MSNPNNDKLVIDKNLTLHFATEKNLFFLKELYNDPQIQSFSLEEENKKITNQHILNTIKSFTQ